jgi:hypothetical protein
VHAIHIVESSAGTLLQLNGPASADRVLSDNFTENPIQLMDLGQPADGLHLAFGSQLIYNQKSGQSLFLAALSADRLLTAFHLLSSVGPDAHVLSYDVSDEGTNEALQDWFKDYPPANNVPLSLQVSAGTSIGSERDSHSPQAPRFHCGPHGLVELDSLLLRHHAECDAHQCRVVGAKSRAAWLSILLRG